MEGVREMARKDGYRPHRKDKTGVNGPTVLRGCLKCGQVQHIEKGFFLCAPCRTKNRSEREDITLGLRVNWGEPSNL
jgi:hypothetical protein